MIYDREKKSVLYRFKKGTVAYDPLDWLAAITSGSLKPMALQDDEILEYSIILIEDTIDFTRSGTGMLKELIASHG